MIGLKFYSNKTTLQYTGCTSVMQKSRDMRLIYLGLFTQLALQMWQLSVLALLDINPALGRLYHIRGLSRAWSWLTRTLLLRMRTMEDSAIKSSRAEKYLHQIKLHCTDGSSKSTNNWSSGRLSYLRTIIMVIINNSRLLVTMAMNIKQKSIVSGLLSECSYVKFLHLPCISLTSKSAFQALPLSPKLCARGVFSI